MAGTAGVSKSAVSRRFIEQAEAALVRMMERDFKDVDILAVYIDGIQIAGHHVIAALGLDAQGDKHVLGLVCGLPSPAGEGRHGQAQDPRCHSCSDSSGRYQYSYLTVQYYYLMCNMH